MHDRNRVTFDLTSGANAAVGQGVPMIHSVTAAKRIIATIAALSLLIGACGSDQEDETSDTTANTSSTTTTIEATTTTTTATTTTTLSEQDAAEAEVEQLVIDWWTAPADSSQGENQEHLQYLTGLIRKRSIDSSTARTEDGQILVSNGDRPIEITDVLVDLETGRGELDACIADNAYFLDSETGEKVGEEGDPSFSFTSEFLVELTDDGWKIHEWYPSYNTGNPIECTIETE